jgi:hypothetical protein
MGSFQTLKAKCAACHAPFDNGTYGHCKDCLTYKELNAVCGICGRLGSVENFIRSTAKGMTSTLTCKICRQKLT